MQVNNLSKVSQLAYTSHAVSSHYPIIDLEMLTTVNEVCQPSSLGLLSLSHLFTLWKTFTALTFWDMMDAAWHWISWYDGPSNLHFFGEWSCSYSHIFDVTYFWYIPMLKGRPVSVNLSIYLFGSFSSYPRPRTNNHMIYATRTTSLMLFSRRHDNEV